MGVNICDQNERNFWFTLLIPDPAPLLIIVVAFHFESKPGSSFGAFVEMLGEKIGRRFSSTDILNSFFSRRISW